MCTTSLGAINRDVTQRRRAENALRQAREELEERVQQRTAELQRAKEELRTEIAERKLAEQELLELSARLLSAQDEERRRLARELHDSTAQTLSALSLNLALLQQQMAGPTLDERAAQALRDSINLASQTARELRTFSCLLHPPLLDQAGLAQALRWYVDGFTQRTAVEVHLEASPLEFHRLPPDMETALFRIVQECLTNIYRHSASERAGVCVIKDPEAITLQVWDEGKGLWVGSLEGSDEPATSMGVGMKVMRERVRQLGGRMEVLSRNPGTLIEVVLPLGGERGGLGQGIWT
jgi:signal transduction histidine kinase